MKKLVPKLFVQTLNGLRFKRHIARQNHDIRAARFRFPVSDFYFFRKFEHKNLRTFRPEFRRKSFRYSSKISPAVSKTSSSKNSHSPEIERFKEFFPVKRLFSRHSSPTEKLPVCAGFCRCEKLLFQRLRRMRFARCHPDFPFVRQFKFNSAEISPAKLRQQIVEHQKSLYPLSATKHAPLTTIFPAESNRPCS